MRPKPLTRLLLHIFTLNAVHAYSPVQSSPDNWSFCCDFTYSGDNYIPDTSTSSHVTGIELGLTTTGAIYTVNILGDGVTRTAVPSGGCSAFSTHTLMVAANERVTVIEAWRNNVNSMWYRLRLTLNTGTIQEYNKPHGGTDTLYTYTI
jgi:hypothetical protein